MHNTDKSSSSNRHRYSHNNWLLQTMYFTGFAGVLFLCIYYTVWGNQDSTRHYEQHSLQTYIDEQKYIESALKDLEKMPAATPAQRDSIIETVRSSQIMVLRQLQVLNDDFRQEMNNNINKINTWLAFAIGVISILGVFVPLALQYRFQTQEEEKFDRLENNNSTKFDHFSRNIKTDIKNLKSNLFKDIHSGKKELETLSESIRHDYELQSRSMTDLREKQKNQLRLSQLSAHFNAFHIGSDNNLLQHNAERESIFKIIWQGTVATFEELAEKCFKNADTSEEVRIDPKHKVFLIEAMIKLHGMVMILKNHRSDGRHRELWDVADNIEKILNQLSAAGHSKSLWIEISKSISVLIKDLNALDVPLNK